MESSLVIIEEDEEPLYLINDKKATNKARATLPDVLYISILSDCTLQFGVFTRCCIPYRTQFGPLDAPLTSYFTAKPSSFLMCAKPPITAIEQDNEEFTNRLFYYTSDESNCNWMCMVRPATSFEDQNMMAHFVDHDVYFTTTRRVEVNEELKVWYSPKYAHFMKKKIFTPSTVVSDVCPDNVSDEVGNMNIFRSCRSQKPSKLLNLVKDFEEEDDVDVRSVPPKKRGWKRANQHLSKLQNIDGSYEMSDPLHENADRKLVALPNDDRSNGQRKLVITVDDVNPLDIPKSPSDKTYVCPVCGKRFGRKYTLKMHSTTHSNSYDYLCHTCGKGYKRKDKLGEHIKRVHLSSKPIKERRRRSDEPRFVPRLKPQDYEKFLFKCLRCSLGFHRRGMLVNHLVKKHPDIDIKTVPELSIPLFKKDILFMCLYCNKSYKSNSKRKRHIEKHHPGEIIPPSLRQTNAMENDTETSGIESKGLIAMEPVMCPYCQSQYTTRSKLNKHISIKHPEKVSSCVVAKQQSPRKKISELKEKQVLDDADENKINLSRKRKRWRCIMKKNSSEGSVTSDHDSEDLASVDNMLMLSNVPPNSFIGNENVADDPGRLVCEDAYMENQQAAQISDMVNPASMVGMNEPPSYTDANVVPISSGYDAEQGIGHIAEVEVEEADDEDDRMNEIMIELNPEVQEHPASNDIEQHQIQTSEMQENVTTVQQPYEKSSRSLSYVYQDNSPQQSRPLPRGRKQFLHTYNEERQSSQSLDRACHRYPTRISSNRQSEFPVVEISYNNQDRSEHQYNVITQTNPACQTTMALTPLSSCDMGWMY